MKIIECEQLSETWFQLRAGRPTASHFDKIVTAKGAPSKQAEKYLYQLAGERLLGDKVETYTNAAMQRGTELEPEARQLFELIHGDVRQVGLCMTDDEKVSCSPDGLMDGVGLEIKCPLIHTHIGYLLGGKLPTEYTQQVQGSMWVTGYSSWFFMSYYPGLKPLIVEAERDDEFCAALKVELDEFCKKLDAMENKLREIGNA